MLLRAVLVAAAAVAIAWLGHGLRALDLAEEGSATLAAAGQPPDARAAESALSSFRAASRRNPDPAPTLEEATLLISIGRARDAARVLEDVVRVNAGNVRAWGLLAAATAQFDQERSGAALSELAALYGRVAVGPVTPETLRGWDGRLYHVVSRTGQGAVEFSRVTDDRITVQGWAADLRARRRVETVVVVSQGRVVAATTPKRRRPDLARRYGPELRSSGFKVSFPRRSAEKDDGTLDVMVFAVSRDEAARLRFVCPSDDQDLGC